MLWILSAIAVKSRRIWVVPGVVPIHHHTEHASCHASDDRTEKLGKWVSKNSGEDTRSHSAEYRMGATVPFDAKPAHPANKRHREENSNREQPV